MQAEPLVESGPLDRDGAATRPWAAPPADWHSSNIGGSPERAVSAEELQLLRQSFERYEIIDCIDRGGQGVVYRARQKGSSREVALKLLLDGPLAGDRQRFRFEREIELIARLRHANIVTLFDSGVARGRLFYAMEFVDGETIDDYCVLNDLSPRSIVQLMVPVCRAIHFAHQNGVIHRDLKPAHILVGPDAQPRVFDFGLAKDLDSSSSDARYSCTGLVVGTLPYLSPEQAGGLDGKSDVRSDVYTLGVILFQLLSELFPYPVDGPPEQVRQTILSTDPLPLRRAVALTATDRALRVHEVNGDLEAIVARALRKEKHERYQSAAELADDLDRYLIGEAVTARAGSRWYVARKLIRKHRAAFGVAAAFGLLLVGSTVAVSLAWADARVQRDVAVGRAEAALDFWEVSVDTVETRVQSLPGGYAVRNDLIEDLYDIASRLDTLDRTNPRLALVAMKLLEKKADITLKQGQRNAAREFYEDLLTQAESAVLTTPGADVHRLRIAAACGLALSTDQPAPLFERALAFGRQALDSCADDDDVRFEFCETLVEFGSYLKRCREESRALEIVDRALGLLPQSAFSPLEPGAWTRLRARALGDRGAVLLKLGRGEEGLQNLYTALDIRERVATACPADTIAADDLMCACYRTGLAELDRGMSVEAVRMLQRGATVGRKLAELDPAARSWDRNRLKIHHDLALLQLNPKEIEAARSNCNLAAQLAERAAAADAEAAETIEDLAFVAVLQGRLEIVCLRLEVASGHFERAREFGEILLQRQPEMASYRCALAATYYWLGKVNREMGRLDAARPCFERAVAMFTQLADGEFNAQIQINQLQAETGLAALLMKMNQSDSDARARILLESAFQRLKRFSSDERLVGYEGQTREIECAIRDNRAVLDRRELARTSESSVE